MLVALTRERGHNDELRHLVGARADVVEIPLTHTYFRPVTQVEDEIRRSGHFGLFRSLVVASARANRYVPSLSGALAERARVFSVGPKTSAVLERSGFKVTHESLAGALDLSPFIRFGPVLLLGAVGGRDDLFQDLKSRRLRPVLVRCYETLAPPLEEQSLEELRRADVVFIGAPSAWRVARDVVSNQAWVLVPGETTLKEVCASHQRALVGWGSNFESAWQHILATSP